MSVSHRETHNLLAGRVARYLP